MINKNFKQYETNLNTCLDSLQFYFPVLNVILVIVGMEYLKTGYLLMFFVHCVMPLLDRYLPHDDVNYRKEDEKEKRYSFFYTLPLYIAIVADLFLMLYTLHKVSYTQLPFIQSLFLVISASLSLGSTINISHELIHRVSRFQQLTGALNLMRCMYGHYEIAHILSHHKYVGTKNDPVVALKDESVFLYILRQIKQTYQKAWICENQRVIKFYQAQNPYLSIYNKMIYYSVAQILFPTVIFKIFGGSGLLAYLLMVIISVVESLIVEYIEHYGLSNYEGINIQYDSSWNAPHKYSNMVSFRFERHSDHHVNAHKQYQVTQFNYEWPTLPESYASCIHIALKPSIWLKVMNQRLQCVLTKKQMTDSQLEEERGIINKLFVEVFSIHSSLFLLSFFL